MAINGPAAAKNALANAYAALGTHAAAFTASPGTTGAATSEVSGGAYVRPSIAWGAAANGVVTGTATFNIPAGVTVTHVAIMGGVSGANLLDLFDGPDQPFTTAGTFSWTFTYTQA